MGATSMSTTATSASGATDGVTLTDIAAINAALTTPVRSAKVAISAAIAAATTDATSSAA
jgi:hypothetical protein